MVNLEFYKQSGTDGVRLVIVSMVNKSAMACQTKVLDQNDEGGGCFNRSSASFSP